MIGSRVGKQVMKLSKQSQGLKMFMRFSRNRNEFDDEDLNEIVDMMEERGEEGFKKVSNYENVISKLSSSLSIGDVLDVFQEHQHLMRNEHLALCLRMLARHIKYSRKQALSDPRFIELQVKVVEQLNNFDEFEVQDLLFWMRKFKMLEIKTSLLDKQMEKIIAMVRDMVDRKNYNFRHLINIYYDLTHLGRYVNSVVDCIANELETDLKLLTPFSINQLMQSMANKKQTMNQKEYYVLDLIYKEVMNILPELEVYQKCLLLKNISTINHYKKGYEEMIKTLCSDLADRLDQMQEVNVITCIKAFKYINNPQCEQLLLAIQDMINVTIEHNSENIKSNFLVDYLLESYQLPSVLRLSRDKALVLLDTLNTRLPVQAVLQRTFFIEKLAQLGTFYKYTKLLHSILETIVKLNIRCYDAAITLANNHININSLIPILDHPSIKHYQKVSLYLLIVYSNTHHKFNQSEKEQELQQEITQSIQKSLGFYAEHINKHPMYFKYKQPLQDILQSIALNIEHIVNYQQLGPIYLRIVTWDNHHQVKKFIIDNFDALDKCQQNGLLSSLAMSYTKYNLQGGPQLSLVLSLLLYKQNTNISLKMLDDLRRTFKLQHSRLIMNPTNIRKIFLLMSIQVSSPDINYNPQAFLSLLRQLHDHDIVNFSAFFRLNINEKYIKILLAIKQKLKQSEEFINLNFNIIQMFLYYKMVTASEAMEMLLKWQTNVVKHDSIYELLSMVVNSKNQSIVDEHKEEVDKMVEVVLTQLRMRLINDQPIQVINGVQQIVKLPSNLYESEKQLILKGIKDYMPLVNIRVYIKFLLSLAQGPLIRVPFQQQVIKTALSCLSNFLENAKLDEFFIILQQFPKLGVRSAFHFNQMLVYYGNNFDKMSGLEKVEVIKVFSQLGINQSDIYQQTIEAVLVNDQIPSIQLIVSLTQVLMQVGQNNQQVNNFLSKHLLTHPPQRKSDANIALLVYIQQQQLDNELPLLTTLLQQPHLQQTITKQLNVHTSHFHKYTIAFIQYFRTKYPEQIENFPFMQEKNQKEYQSKFLDKKVQEQVEVVLEYLQAMGVEYTVDPAPLEFQVANPVILPKYNQKIILSIQRNLNFDRESPTGYFLQRQINFQLQHPQLTSIHINMNRIYELSDEPIDIINYLIQQGIQTSQDTYDFSKITIKTQKKIVSNKNNNKKQQKNISSSSSSDSEDLELNIESEEMLNDLEDVDDSQMFKEKKE